MLPPPLPNKCPRVASEYLPPDIKGFFWFGNSTIENANEAIDAYRRMYVFDTQLVLVRPHCVHPIKWALYYPEIIALVMGEFNE